MEVVFPSVSQCQEETCVVKVENPVDADRKLADMVVQVNGVPGGLRYRDDSTLVTCSDGRGWLGGAVDPADNGRMLTWDLDAVTGQHLELVPGETMTICFTVAWMTSASTVVLETRLHGTEPGDVTVSQMDSAVVAVYPGQITARVEPGWQCDRNDWAAGKTKDWSINISNEGFGNSYDVRVVTTLGEDLSYVAGSAMVNGVVLKSGNDWGKAIVWDMRQFGTDPDGPGGLEDLDGDGEFDDLAPAQTVTISAIQAEVRGVTDLSNDVRAYSGCENTDAGDSGAGERSLSGSVSVMRSDSSDGVSSRLSDRVQAKRPAIRAVPPVLYLRNVSPGARVQQSLCLLSDNDDDFNILNLETNIEGLVLILQERSSGCRVSLDCIYTAPEKSGKVRGYIAVETDQPGVFARIRVSGTVACN